MIKKSLLLCGIALFSITLHTPCSAVEVLRAEDEGILWSWRADADDSDKGTLTKTIGGNMVEQRMSKNNIKIVTKNGLQDVTNSHIQEIAVPDYINAQAPEFANDELAPAHAPYMVRRPAPRAMAQNNQPINLGRLSSKEMSRRKWYKPNMSAASRAHQALIFSYLEAIDACTDNVSDRLAVEESFINQGNLYNNSAYLSNTFKEIEQCYDDIGLDIIDDFYDSDPEVWKEYNRRVQGFHVNSHDVLFNPRYCGEGSCSMKAIADLQMDKFDEYKAYLIELLENAPEKVLSARANQPQNVTVISPEIRVPAAQIVTNAYGQPAMITYPAANEIPVTAAVEQNGQYRTVTSDGRHNTHRPLKRRVPKTVRVQKPNGETEIIRWQPNQSGASNVEMIPIDDANAPLYREVSRQAPMAPSSGYVQTEFDDVPMIDEEDL